MNKLSEFLLEQKNTHMTHINDLVVLGGVDGTRDAINFIRELRDMLGGRGGNVDLTMKLDGSPAVFAGIHPETGEFFVAKKGLFNKNPKYYTSHEEIDADVSNADLSKKLHVAFDECQKLGIKRGVYQGDIMYTKSDLRLEKIDGQRYVTFHPNTILYAIPHGTPLAKKIMKSNIGIVWHTEYKGSTLESMSANFRDDITKNFKETSSSWMADPKVDNVSNEVLLSAKETKAINEILSQVGRIFSGTSSKLLKQISSDKDLSMYFLTFTNSKIRGGSYITDPRRHTEELYSWINQRFEKEIEKKKTLPAKQKWEDKKQEVFRTLDRYGKQEISKVFELMMLLADAKQIIIEKLNQIGSLKTFLKTKDGFRVTGQEGFVAISGDGSAVKLVDQLEFSLANFSDDFLKGWQR